MCVIQKALPDRLQVWCMCVAGVAVYLFLPIDEKDDSVAVSICLPLDWVCAWTAGPNMGNSQSSRTKGDTGANGETEELVPLTLLSA